MRRGRVLILLGLILAIGTAAVVFILLQGAAEQPAVEVERVEVVVATQPIDEAGVPVEGRVQLEARPIDTVPEGAIRSVEAVAGLLSAGPIPQGTVLHPSMVISPLELAQESMLGKIVDQGFVAVAFPINELSSVSYGIKPGDHVDVLMSFYYIDVDQEYQSKGALCPPLCDGPEGRMAVEPGEQFPRLATQLTVQNVEVLGVGRWAYKPPPPSEEAQQEGEAVAEQPPAFITLMLSPQDALVLKMAREAGANIDLAVRAEDDLQVFSTQQVTLDYIMARFGVSVPTKQPYTLETMERLIIQGGE